MISKNKKLELQAKVSNIKLPLSERKVAYQEQLHGVLNPFETFDPNTFDPYGTVEDYDVKKRDRVLPPSILPDMGMSPKVIMEGQMIGMYESKQDLYLLIAWMSRRMTALEQEVDSLKKKPQ